MLINYIKIDNENEIQAKKLKNESKGDKSELPVKDFKYFKTPHHETGS